jgi:hypothetical protein
MMGFEAGGGAISLMLEHASDMNSTLQLQMVVNAACFFRFGLVERIRGADKHCKAS